MDFKSSLQEKLKNITIKLNEDLIPGGVGDDMSTKDIAKKHGVSEEEIKKEFEIGIKVEMEHAKDEKKAREIAQDHITEHPKYYSDKKHGLKANEKKLTEIDSKTIATQEVKLATDKATLAKQNADAIKKQASAPQVQKPLEETDSTTNINNITEQEAAYKMVYDSFQKELEESTLETPIMEKVSRITKSKTDLLKEGWAQVLTLKNEQFNPDHAMVMSKPEITDDDKRVLLQAFKSGLVNKLMTSDRPLYDIIMTYADKNKRDSLKTFYVIKLKGWIDTLKSQNHISKSKSDPKEVPTEIKGVQLNPHDRVMGSMNKRSFKEE